LLFIEVLILTVVYTDKNENQIFLIYKEIQSGAVQSHTYMKKGFLIYEGMRKNFTIYEVRIEEAVSHALQRQNIEISKQIFPEKEYRGLNPNFHIHASVSDLYIPTIGLPILLEEICRPILGK
jgi:hypothetical protein